MRRLLLGLGFLLTLVSALAVLAEFSPVAAVAETRPAGLGLAAAACLLFGILAWRAPGAPAVPGVGFVLALAVAGFAAQLAWFTYQETDLEFWNKGVTLRGTLVAPLRGAPFPAVVFLHGSGPETRREAMYLAKLFARHGIAGFAYDKRGAGKSQGSTYSTDYAGYADDATAALAALAVRSELDRRRFGLFGHSEGGWVAPLVVERWPETAFVIVTSTTHLSPAEQVEYEAAASVAAAGHSAEEAERARRLMRRALAFDRGAEDAAALNSDLLAAAREPWFEVSGIPRSVDRGLDVSWWRSVMDYDALPLWRRVHCPVLMVSGGQDLNSDAAASQHAITRALAEGGNQLVTRRIFPNMEHGTIEWWLPGRLPPPRFPSGYPELLVAWARERAGI